ncbi:RHOMBOID-like protein 10, chloroplastic isoform X2 [Diospyros lotus]|uniref:RHOMBOID-like protein 10, chloroplastic isoform X2 n=1 Tax=Diospyros lotus TaxID=55363 RepID=UPI00225188F7|nr:RHOMBOID-like protein 10, chloroplastic isoform X2 [Diospyros lotus]
MVGSAVPQPHHQPSKFFPFPLPISRVGPTPGHLITTAASLRLGRFLRHRFSVPHHSLRLGFLLQSSLMGYVPHLKDVWHESSSRFKTINFLQWPEDAVSTALSSWFFSGEGSGKNSGDIRSDLQTSRRISFSGRGLTDILLMINVLVYIAQIATQGKLLLWGAKINSLIDKGQLWRLATSSLLHANIGHLLVNCYSLNSVGPTVESISGPRRYLAVYITSAIASSAMSYWLCKSPAVGASGAIFGLVGSFAVFVLRHRGLVRGGKEDLKHIAHVIVLNMVIGLLSKGIDNWGHVGGLLGGAATSWFLGPAWRYESLSNDGRKVLADRAPVFSLINTKKKHR